MAQQEPDSERVSAQSGVRVSLFALVLVLVAFVTSAWELHEHGTALPVSGDAPTSSLAGDAVHPLTVAVIHTDHVASQDAVYPAHAASAGTVGEQDHDEDTTEASMPDAGSPVAEPIYDRAGLQEYLRNVASRWDRTPLNDGLSTQVSTVLESRIRAGAMGADIQDVDCRADVCRITIQFADSAQAALAPRLAHDPGRQLFVYQPPNIANAWTAVAYSTESL